MLSKLQRHHQGKESGFSLTELLVVVFIMGVVFAIAVPAFTLQRKNSIDKSVESDVVAANSTIETWIIRHPASKIPDGTVSQNADGTPNVSSSLTNSGLRNFRASEGTTLTIKGNTNPLGTYTIVAKNPNGNKSAATTGWTYDSSKGGFQQ